MKSFNKLALFSQEPCKMKSFNKLALFAGVAELADAQDLGSCGRKAVQVQLLSPAPMSFGLPLSSFGFLAREEPRLLSRLACSHRARANLSASAQPLPWAP